MFLRILTYYVHLVGCSLDSLVDENDRDLDKGQIREDNVRYNCGGRQ